MNPSLHEQCGVGLALALNMRPGKRETCGRENARVHLSPSPGRMIS